MASNMSAADSGRAGRLRWRVRIGGTAPVWVLNAAIIAFGVSLHLAVGRHIGVLDSKFSIPWFVLAIAFGVAEVHVIHLRFRSEVHSFSLNEIPLILGLFFASANGLVLAQLVGALIALVVHRRQPLLKLVFNLAAFSLEATLAAAVFRAVVAHSDPLGPAGWFGAFVATSVSSVVAIVAIVLAIFM